MDEESIFAAALQKSSDAERAAFLDEVCRDDARLRAEIQTLLLASDRAGSFLEFPALEIAAAKQEMPAIERPGTVLGPYKLLEQIGEGGFGVVFMAEQRVPVRRKVALKIIKPGMDSKQVVARFEAERQALALMDHPNIARVLEAGTTESGRPFFVMELVHGVAITQFCDQERLTPYERLKLFAVVCRAVQHAHQKGVIHRDLKPSNIMVTMHDEKPVPKIIDFGISKAISQQLTEKTLFTAYGQMVGTPMYMSPEQAQLSGLDVDTRSDVYSLGVLLYELVTGTTPFDEATLKRVGFDEMRRIIREDEPLHPSAQVQTLKGDQLSTVADQRKVDARKLSQTLRGEVDWIVMKALEKDRNRRYESANGLAQDIERYLKDEPVLACPPSTTYRFGKFVRRHKAVLAPIGMLAGVVLLAVVGLAIGTVLIWRANTEARRLAYFQRVALAEREWVANNFKRADELLALCPTDLRGWEWNYVKRLRGQQLPPLRHDNTIADCAVSPDGTQIVSLDWTGFVHCWDVPSGQEARPPMRGHESSEGVITDVVFSPDGRHFATTGWHDVKVWDAQSGKTSNHWMAPPNSMIQGIAYESAGRLLVCVITKAGEKDQASIWDPVAGRKLFSLPHVPDTVLDLAISPDDRVLALACVDNTVRLLEARTGKASRTLHGTRPFWCVSFSPDGSLVAAGTGGEAEQDSGTVGIWEVTTGRERPPLTGHGAQCLTFSPDGKRLATGGSDQSVKIWDIASSQEILTLRGHTDFVQGIHFTPDGWRLISSGERSIRIWDGTPWREGERFGDEVLTLSGHTDSVNSVAFRPGAAELVTASTDGTLKFWSTQTWRELRSVRTRFKQVSELAVSSVGDRLAISGFQANQRSPVLILDANTGAELVQLDDLWGDQAIAFAAGGKQLAVGNEEGVVTLFDVATGEARGRFEAPGRFPYSVTFSPDEGLLALCHDNNIRIWETATGREIEASPLTHRGMIYSVAFSPDGRFLASGGWDRTVRTWDTSAWKQVQVLIDSSVATQSVAFSPDGEFLAWGATDSAVKLWNRSTGELHTLRGHVGNIRSVAFSPDGNSLASASEDGTAKIWKVPGNDTTVSNTEEYQ